MKVLDLVCAEGHVFEGWFGSEAEFQGQHARGLIACPLCGDKAVTRRPSAPRLNLSGAREPAAAAAPGPAAAVPAASPGAGDQAALQAAWLRAVQQVFERTEDVGERFPEEARRIHYGETEARGIRGQASAEERAALAEEGIEVVALPLPVPLKDGQH